jgi:hypothetical protein
MLAVEEKLGQFAEGMLDVAESALSLTLGSRPSDLQLIVVQGEVEVFRVPGAAGAAPCGGYRGRKKRLGRGQTKGG